MMHRSERERTGTPTVLREVVVASQPHALVLPGQTQKYGQGMPPASEEACTTSRQRGYDEGYKQGRERGFDEGRREGFLQGQAQAEKAAQVLAAARDEASASQHARQARLDALLGALPGAVAARVQAAEEDMLALCLEAITRVLGASIVQPAGVRAMLEQAMSQWQARQPAALHLHPDDLTALESDPAQAAWLQQCRLSMQWVASDEVALGGCVLRSPEGGLDARLETQLQALRDILLQARSERAQEPAP